MDQLQQEGTSPRRVAVLFTDMKGSTTFYKAHGNLAGRIMIQKHNDLLFPIIREHKGIIVNTMGDSIFAYFPAAGNALRASITMQKRLAAYNDEAQDNERLLIRIAMNFGECIVEEKDVFGHAVDVASKLVAACEPQEILITAAFQECIRNLPQVICAPYSLKNPPEVLRSIPVYSVAWQQASDDDYSSLCCCTVRVVGKSPLGASPQDIQAMIPLLSQRGGQIMYTDAEGIDAAFANKIAGLQAAAALLQHLQLRQSDDAGAAPAVKVGMHLASISTDDDERDVNLFNQSRAACTAAGANEIVLTQLLYQNLPAFVQKVCLPCQDATPAGELLYRYQAEAAVEQSALIVPVIPDAAVDPHGVACFYCGMTLHEASRCPSKLLRSTTDYLERLSHMPFKQIQQIYQDFFPDYVRPLETGADENRYDILFDQEREGPFALGFFALYEISEIFQLRSLHRLYDTHDAGQRSSQKTSGALMIGRDCVRVSRGDTADQWFEQAIKENPNDYRPYVDMGIVSMERSDPTQSLSYLRKALSYAQADPVKHHIGLLTARVYETAGAISHARDEMQKILSIAPTWHSGLYYFAVLQAKLGKVGAAIDIFKKLLEYSDRYYLIISLDPELNTVRKHLNRFLNKQLEQIRSRCQDSFASIVETFNEIKKWFSETDPEYKTSRELYQKCSAYMREESVSGLFEISSAEIELDRIFRRAVEQRRHQAEDKVARFRNIHADFERYLDRYPYKQALTSGDFKLRDSFKTLFDATRKAIDTISLQRLQESQKLIAELAVEADKITAARQRLDITKNIYFIIEFSLKLAGSFFGTGIAAAFVFTLLLSAYQVYSGSFASLSLEALVGYIRYGLIIGFFSGLLGAAIWFTKRFRRMYAKITD